MAHIFSIQESMNLFSNLELCYVAARGGSYLLEHKLVVEKGKLNKKWPWVFKLGPHIHTQKENGWMSIARGHSLCIFYVVFSYEAYPHVKELQQRLH